jgi:hypothetical protein
MGFPLADVLTSDDLIEEFACKICTELVEGAGGNVLGRGARGRGDERDEPGGRYAMSHLQHRY